MSSRQRVPHGVGLWVLACVAATALVGCVPAVEGSSPDATSSMAPSSTSSPAPTPSPTSGATAEERLEQLHAAVSATTVGCSDWQLDPQYPWPTGRCVVPEMLLIAVEDSVARNDVLQRNLDSLEPGIFLYGDDWLINVSYVDDASRAALAEQLGAPQWTAADPIPAP